jgi:thiamine biosynthesis lipoprotein
MKKTNLIMGMPITIEVQDPVISQKDIDEIFQYFTYVDEVFSTYKPMSEISLINRGILDKEKYSKDMKEVLDLSEETKKVTNGYFEIFHKGTLDPSGLVKGWAVYKASKMLKDKGLHTFYIDAGGDIQAEGKPWSVGIRNPFNETEIIKVLSIKDKGVATSGTYNRGHHVYNPLSDRVHIDGVVSITIIGPNVYEADRFATAAFAMGKQGINYIEKLSGFEGYMIDVNGVATFTSLFEEYIQHV